jgi:hypothetical protein
MPKDPLDQSDEVVAAIIDHWITLSVLLTFGLNSIEPNGAKTNPELGCLGLTYEPIMEFC